jgi:predicted DNA-binding transcriptional regulator AlpA
MPEAATSLPPNVYDRRLLSGKQVCELLNIKRTALYLLGKRTSDPIPSIMIGGRRRYQAEKVLWWIENQHS